MKKENEYIKNTIILLIGKFSSQIISFLMLPIYTYTLEINDYGYVDLLHTYICLIAPIVMLQLDSAIFRFFIDCRKNRNEQKIISSTALHLTNISIVISLIIFFIIYSFIKVKYAFLVIIYAIAYIYNLIFMAMIRGIGKNEKYSICSAIIAFSTLIITLILIFALKYGAETILIASIMAYIINVIYIIISEKISLYRDFRYFNKSKALELLKYSIPMIPNMLSWWIVSLSDRTIIATFCGVAANGIYSIASKFSNLLNSIFSIFSMSWQETVTIHINDKDAKEFFSKMIEKIFDFFVFISNIIVGMLPIVFEIVIGNEYRDAYNYIPILLIANLFNVIIGLIGGIYVARKQTSKVAMTTAISAIINIGINFLFIKKYGLYAATMSTVIAYVIMTIYRYKDVKKIIDIKLNLKRNYASIVLFIINLFLYYYQNKFFCFLITILIIICYLKNNYEYINIIKKKIKNIIGRYNKKEGC